MSSESKIRIVCPECGAGMKMDAEYLGERIECPKCSEEFTAKEPKAAKPKPVPVRSRDEDDDERPAKRKKAREYDDEDEDDYDDDRDDGPRPGECPECGSRKSTKVSFTWWGGLVGPAIYGIVKCKKCSTQYAKKTGQRIGAATIIIYSAVVFVISMGIVVALALAGK